MKELLSGKWVPMSVGTFVFLFSLILGVGFYWSKGIALDFGGVLGLAHAAMGFGLFCGVGAYIISKFDSKKKD